MSEDERAVPLLPDNAIVIRFRPTMPESVLNWARKEYRRTGRYRVSVFADAPREGEDDQAVIDRLLKVSQLMGIDPCGNKKFYVCARASELADRGFTFHKDGDEDEADEHYSVDLGADPSVDDVVRFLDPFEERRRL